VRYFALLHFAQVLLVAEHYLEEGLLVDGLSLVDLGDSEEERGEEVVEHAVVELLQVASGEPTVNRHDKIIVSTGIQKAHA
jgi:hypothetical protein